MIPTAKSMRALQEEIFKTLANRLSDPSRGFDDSDEAVAKVQNARRDVLVKASPFLTSIRNYRKSMGHVEQSSFRHTAKSKYGPVIGYILEHPTHLNDHEIPIAAINYVDKNRIDLIVSHDGIGDLEKFLPYQLGDSSFELPVNQKTFPIVLNAHASASTFGEAFQQLVQMIQQQVEQALGDRRNSYGKVVMTSPQEVAAITQDVMAMLNLTPGMVGQVLKTQTTA